jgi:hypothetical protein
VKGLKKFAKREIVEADRVSAIRRQIEAGRTPIAALALNSTEGRCRVHFQTRQDFYSLECALSAFGARRDHGTNAMNSTSSPAGPSAERLGELDERIPYCRLRVSSKTEDHSLRIGTFERISIDAESFNALDRGRFFRLP